MFLLFCGSSIAAENVYPHVNDFIASNYTKSGDKDYPWHKVGTDDEDSELSNYSLCENKPIPNSDSMILIVMCPDTAMASLNEGHPTDIYIIKKSNDDVKVLAQLTDAGVDFESLISIGIDKWGIIVNSYFMGRGLMQGNTDLLILKDGNLLSVANWTSVLDNSGAVDDSPELASIKNTISFNQKSKTISGFYPVHVKSEIIEGTKRTIKNYTIDYNPKTFEYDIPEDLQQGY